MVTKFFRNSNFSDFLGIKSEIHHCHHKWTPQPKNDHLQALKVSANNISSFYDIKIQSPGIVESGFDKERRYSFCFKALTSSGCLIMAMISCFRFFSILGAPTQIFVSLKCFKPLLLEFVQSAAVMTHNRDTIVPPQFVW